MLRATPFLLTVLLFCNSVLGQAGPRTTRRSGLELCQGYDGCNYFVHYGAGVDDCYAFANCQRVSQDTCEDCYVGSVECDDLVCWARESCQGPLIDNLNVDREDDCLRQCKDVATCSWFTYQEDSHACLLLGSCALKEECQACWSGQSQCSERKDSDKVLVVTGRTPGVSYSDRATVLDLSGEGDCPDASDYPISLYGATGAFVGGAARVCGGTSDTEVHLSTCYEYDAEGDRWLDVPPMIVPRSFGSSSALDTDTWLISGGYNSDQPSLDSTEIWTSAGGFSEGPTLPTPLWAHCQVTLNASHVFFGGNATGSPGSPAYLLDWRNNEWTVLPDTPRERYDAGCGYIFNAEGEQEVVVANRGTSDVLNLADLEWRSGPDIPTYSFYGSSVQLKDTFVIVGGDGSEKPGETIHKFDEINYGWTTLTERLEPGGLDHVAVSMSDDAFEC